MVSLMKILCTLMLLSAATLVSAQAAKGEQDALALAIASRHTLNEYAIGAVEPEAMKYTQRLRLTRAALDTQRKQWPAVTSGSDPSDKYSACRNALEQASHVAGLSGIRAFGPLEDKIFNAEKSHLKQLRSDCDELVKRGRKPG